MLELSLLGSPQISLAGAPLSGFVTRKAEALLIYLAVTGREHTRDAIAGLFWRDGSDAQARNSLRRILPNLRKLVGAYIDVDRQTISLRNDAAVAVDVAQFCATVEALRSPAHRSALDLARLESALNLYQGDFLAGFYVRDTPAFEEWVLLQREYMRELAVFGFTLLADHYLEREEYTAGLATSARLLALEPWCETAHYQQMLCFARTGKRTEALAQYENCRAMLAQEFDTQPSAEMTALFEQIKTNSPSAEPTQAAYPVVTSVNGQATNVSGPQTAVEWGEVPRRVRLFGRQHELAALSRWLLHDQASLVVVLGVGGAGKTTLAAALCRSLAEPARQELAEKKAHAPFERIIWRSLLNAPTLASILRMWLQTLSAYQLTALPPTLDEQLALLFTYLRQQRCLLVLDNLESILQPGEPDGHYLPGYEEYGLLIQRMGEQEHQSCLLITSRELPLGIARLERNYPTVRSLPLTGLPVGSALELLRAAGLQAEAESAQELVQRYSGNPLALRVVADMVADYYRGDASAFLHEETLIFEDIRSVLEQQFQRLSALERELLTWLTIEREPVSMQAVREDFAQPPAKGALIEALRSLDRRSLSVEEKEIGVAGGDGERRVGLQNVVLEYSTECLVASVYAELINGEFDYLRRYALVKAPAKDYVRQAQVRLLLQPIAQKLLEQYGQQGVANRLKTLLTALHSDIGRSAGYAPANLLHLALHLGIDLTGWDFSRLPVWQADLRAGRLPYVNFSQAQFINTAFMERFDAILAVNFSADGALLAAGGASGDIQLWRAHDNHLLAICPGNGRWVWTVAFSPDGQTLASAGSDCTVRLWNLADLRSSEAAPGGASLTNDALTGHTDTIFSVAFDPTGEWLASAGADHTIRLWDVAHKRSVGVLAGHTGTVYALAFSPRQRLLASASRDETVRLWRVDSGECRQILSAHVGHVSALDFSADGELLASGGLDNILRVWQIDPRPADGAALAQLVATLDNRAEITTVAFSPDGRTIAANGASAALRLWQWRAGELVKSFHGHSESVQALAFSPDGAVLASGGWDKSVRFWDVDTGYPLRTLQGYTNTIATLALSPDGQTLVSGNADATLGVWHLPTQRLLQVQKSHAGAVTSVAFHPGGKLFVSSGADSTIQLWALDAGQIALARDFSGHESSVLCTAFSPSGQLLASGSADSTVRLWETETGLCRHVLRRHKYAVGTLTFHPTGAYLVSGGDGGQIYRWEIGAEDAGAPERSSSLQAAQLFATLTGGVSTLAFSPDGSILAGAGPDHVICLWRACDGKMVLAFETPVNSTIYALAFRPKQKTGFLELASSSGTGAICLWEIDLAAERHALKHMLNEHTGSVSSIRYTPDGNTLISGGADETIRLWAATGRCLATIPLEPPYAGMNVLGATGITAAQRAAIRALGAIEGTELLMRALP